jgi:hypothetical protein
MVTLVLLSSLSSWLKVKSVVSVDWTEAVRFSVGPSPDTLILGQKKKLERERVREGEGERGRERVSSELRL